MKSTHIPEYSGDIVEVTGSLTVETELRDVQSLSVSLAQGSTAASATVSGSTTMMKTHLFQVLLVSMFC